MHCVTPYVLFTPHLLGYLQQLEALLLVLIFLCVSSWVLLYVLHSFELEGSAHTPSLEHSN